MATPFLKKADMMAADKWFVIDAANSVVGRVASRAASILIGKHKPQYVPFMVSGDHVVIINADKMRLTGQKVDQKVYRWHTQYPGGLRETPVRRMLETKPEKVIREAVMGMLPKNRLRSRMINRLKIYVGDQHPHKAQKPEAMSL